MQGPADSDNSYRYFKIGKYLACLDQSILDIVKIVILGYKRNNLSAIGVSRSFGKATIRAILKDKLRLLSASKMVELPVFGHIGMQVHRGCKVFDFDRQLVTKVFDPETDSQDATKEIAASKHASEVAAAPRFIAEDPNRAWYQEEYICGVHATDAEFRDGAEIMDFYPDVEKCLLDLVARKQPIYIDTMRHINNHADDSFRNRWLSAGQDAKKVGEIEDFIERLREWLAIQSKPDQLQLVLTHGDFSLVNAIATSDGLRFIDWEGVSFGGIYSDVFHFLFAEHYYGRTSGNFLKELPVFVERYREASQMRFPDLRDAAELDLTFARRLYYLERVSLLLDRATSSNLCRVVCNSIALFRDFDRDAGDDAVQAGYPPC